MLEAAGAERQRGHGTPCATARGSAGRAAGARGIRGPLKPNSSSFSIYCLLMEPDMATDFILSYFPPLPPPPHADCAFF